MPCGATQDRRVMVERSDRMWSTGEENDKPLQYSCLENPMNSMKRQSDRILKEELPRSVGAQYATGDQWRNNSRKNEKMEPKQKQYPVIYLGPNYGGGNEDNGNVLQKVPGMHCYRHCPQPCSRPPPDHTSAGDTGHSWASLGQSLVGSLLLSPGSWCTTFFLYPPRVCSPVLCKFWWLCGGVNGDLLQEGLCHTQVCCTQSPRPCGSPLLTCPSRGDAHTVLSQSL